MASIQPIFTTIRGMATDPPLDQTPAGFVRRVLDATPGRGLAPTQVRGGWAYATGNVGAGAALDWIAWAPFSGVGTDKIVAYSVADSRSDYVSVLDGSTTGALVGVTPVVPVTAPFFHRTPTGGLMIYPGAGAASVVLKWPGTGALANLGGSPPKADRGASWGDYLILAGDLNAGQPQGNRAWFSAVGNPEAWDLLNGYVDMPEDIVAVVPRGTSIYFFGAKGTHIMVGDQPPPGGNMTLKKYIFSQGLSDPDAVALYKDFVIWGNGNGIFRSDGSQPSDLTSISGVSSYWPFCYSPVAGDKLNLGCYRQYLIANILTSANVFKRCLVFDLEQSSAWEWGNIAGRHLLRIPSWSGSTEDLLMPVGRRIARLAPSFTPASVVDGDGNLPLLMIRTGGLRFGAMGEKRFRRGWLTFTGDTGTVVQTYGSVDAAIDMSQDPTTPPPNLFSLGNFGPAASALNRIVRVPLRIHRKAELIRYEIIGSTELRIYGMEQEISAYDDTRAGDLHA